MNKFQNLLKDKKLLIFDFDGTIADTSPFHDQAFKEVLLNYPVDFSYKDIAGLSSSDAFKTIFKKNNISISKQSLTSLIDEKQEIARNLISKFLKPVEGLYQFLKYADNHFQICIVSSGSNLSITNALKKIKLYMFFDEIISAEDVKNTKPSPEGFCKALDIFGISPDQALIFEDSVSGFQAADAANIDYLDVNSFIWSDLY
tara:strand:- start:7154 stop:7759 length:606 start_codon:yes stop_codon:yes gene_type:complete